MAIATENHFALIRYKNHTFHCYVQRPKGMKIVEIAWDNSWDKWPCILQNYTCRYNGLGTPWQMGPLFPHYSYILLPYEIPIPYGKMNESPVSQGGAFFVPGTFWMRIMTQKNSPRSWGIHLWGPYQTPTNWLLKHPKARATVLVCAHNIMGDFERNMFHAYGRI